ncbi:MAG: TetR/AcrR family transcriptional regulator [Pseudomonadota bacterium]
MNIETQIKRGRKFDQVLDGARKVFMNTGYEGASVDMIAKTAGVSKATLYSYFPDKSILFVEVAKDECTRQAERSLTIEDMEAGPRTVLTQVGRNMVDFITSPFAQRVFRICVAESDRFPELGREFYQTGPARAHEMMTVYLSIAAGRGEMEIDDIDMAAMQFSQLCKAHLFDQLVFNVIDEASQADKDHVVSNAVETFLARYGTGRI